MKCEDCKWYGNCIVRGTVCQNYVGIDGSIILVNHPKPAHQHTDVNIQSIDGSITPVNHPKHYNGKYECIEVMRDVFGEDAVKSFCILNAFKYIWRHNKKNGTEDLKKAKWYLEFILTEDEDD